jgi:DNA-binding NtrC family response regulator
MAPKEKKNLEETIKEKIAPLLEETMEKNWGISIPKIETDISDKLKNQSLDIYIPINKSFSEAKRIFKTEFLKQELKLNRGNISQIAKTLGIDRRSIHRAIKELGINVDEIRGDTLSKKEYQENKIDQTIRTTLEQYKSIIQPQQMEKMYQEVGKLSRNIARFIPHQELSWKEAERAFEKQFLKLSLEDNEWNVTKTAKKIIIRPETLHRKIKKLGI